MARRGSLPLLLAGCQILGILQAGCVANRLAPTIVNYNLAVEQAQNEVLLLNAIRSAKKQPFYLTDISKINGSIKRDLTASVAAPFGSLHKGTGANNTTTAGATYTVNPTFDVNVLNSQDFMKGFLRPIDPDLFAYYWGQGWPRELLLYLFVQKVQVQTSEGNLITYDNHPRFEEADDPATSELACFGRWVTSFLSGDPHLIPTEPENVKVGPSLGDAKISGFNDVIGAEKGQLSLELVDPNPAKPLFQLKRQKRDYTIVVRSQDYKECDRKPRADIEDLTSLEVGASMAGVIQAPPAVEIEIPSADKIDQPVASHIHGWGVATESGKKKTGKIVQNLVLSLRSPEGVLYYLGQLMRLEQHSGLTPRITVAAKNDEYKLTPLFVAFPPDGISDGGEKLPDCRQRSVSVTDGEGEVYIIPRRPQIQQAKSPLQAALGESNPLKNKGQLTPADYFGRLDNCEPGESMRVLSILTQLIGLQKTAQDFPPTTTVRAVGQ